MITSEGNFILATPTKCGTTTLEAIAKRHMRNNMECDDFRIMDWDSPRRQHRMALPPYVGDEDIDVVDPYGERLEVGARPAEDEWGGVDRYLFVRNPFTRYVSVYNYLRAPQNYSQWGARQVQGSAWPGLASSDYMADDPMTFEEFLFWLADERAGSLSRLEFTSGGAYRSPWVWTDSLTMSLDFLACQPGAAEGEVGLVRLENIDAPAAVEGSLAWLLAEYGLGSSVRIGGIHANRTTAYGDSGADVASGEFWGGVACTAGALFFAGDTAVGRVRTRGGQHCGACAIGVAEEASALGYLA